MIVMLLSVSVIAIGEEEKKTVRVGNEMITRSEMRATMQRVAMKRYGGYVRKENSAQGTFVFLNTQKTIPVAEIEKAANVITSRLRFQAKIVEANDISLGTIKERIAKAGGIVGVAIVESKDPLPALLSATEEGWAIVNAAKLSEDAPSSDVLNARARRELLRGFAFAVGGVYGARGDAIMQPVRTPKDLDKIVHEDFAPTMRQTFSLVTPMYGFLPWKESTYLNACEQGWAPAPTNDNQKAIWDKVHEIPTNPIKIKFDPKTGK